MYVLECHLKLITQVRLSVEKLTLLKIIVLEILLCALLSGMAMSDENLTCNLCDQTIESGKYVTLGDLTYHENCFKKSSRCVRCGFPIKGKVVKDEAGRVYHQSCYDDTLQCSWCRGTILGGKYVELDNGLTFHHHCFSKAPRCEICRVPLVDTFHTKDGKNYCDDCYTKMPRCTVCNLPIKGTYSIDVYGRNSCSRHEHVSPCSICGFHEEYARLSDGRTICRQCSDAAVMDAAHGKILMEQVKQALSQLLPMNFEEQVRLHVVDHHEFSTISSAHNESRLGSFVTKTETVKIPLLGEKKITSEYTIYLLSGLPEELFKSVLAHELTHFWQRTHCSEGQSKYVTEGTAELVSYLYLKSKNDRFWHKKIDTNEVALYRKSFEKALFYYEALGHDLFFQKIPRITRFTELDKYVD